MLRRIIFFLFLTGAGNAVQAQFDGRFYMRGPMSEQLFNTPKPKASSVSFDFWLSNNRWLTYEMQYINQLNHLPNLDSLFTTVKKALKPLQDSLKADGLVRRLDYVANENNAPQIRIVAYDNRPTSYTYLNNELVQLKVDMDTLRICIYTTVGKKVPFYANGSKELKDLRASFIIMFQLNNISDIENLPDATLSQCLSKVKEATTSYISPDSTKIKRGYYRASFNMVTGKMFSPGKTKWIRNAGNQVQELVPNVYGSFQYALGSFIPSMGAGLRYTFADRRYAITRLYAMWEPHFFFTRDIANKLVTDRNDFITLRLTQVESKQKEGFDFVTNFSFGYLVNRNGNWFEPNTFKLGIPGVRSGWLQLEPEFFFTGLFKNFSPSLKLTLHYE